MRRVLFDLANLTAGQLAGDEPVAGGSGCLTWHSTIESTGSAAAEYILWDGQPSATARLMDVSLTAGESTRDPFVLHSLPFLNGLYLTVPSGEIGGSLTFWLGHQCEAILDMQQRLREFEYFAAFQMRYPQLPSIWSDL